MRASVEFQGFKGVSGGMKGVTSGFKRLLSINHVKLYLNPLNPLKLSETIETLLKHFEAFLKNTSEDPLKPTKTILKTLEITLKLHQGLPEIFLESS